MLQDAGDGYGGAIYNKGGTLTVTRSTFLDNTATFGGGIGNRLGTTTVSDSTFTGNYSYSEGGGLASHANAMTVMNSTFTQNGSSAGGAGLMIRGGIVTLSNLTITKNEDRWPGAGIGIQFDDLTSNPASLLIINCTITENETDRFGGGIAVTPTPFYWPTITNTIIANNHAFTGDEDVNGGFCNGGHNLIGPMDLKAAPLGDYGGPTQTIALLSGSPAIDAGDNAAAPLTDQRGVTRPYNDIVDIGAFEVNDPTPPVITPTVTGTIGNNGWYISDVVVSWTVTDAESPLQIENGCLETAINTDTVGTSVDCKAISGGGEASASVPITRDATHPVVSYAGNQPAYSLLETVSITCSAGDATSGIATDTCADINGPAASFAPGVNTFSAAATDNAGHEAQASVSFTVAATHADLCALTTRYVSQRIVGHLACGALSMAQQASAHQFPFISSFALNLYRVQIHLATKRYLITPLHGAELINWSRTL